MIADTLVTLAPTALTGIGGGKAAGAGGLSVLRLPLRGRGGADVSITGRLDPKVKVAIVAIDEHAWTPIEYTDAVYDDTTRRWISRAEVAETGFTAFSSRKTAQQI